MARLDRRRSAVKTLLLTIAGSGLALLAQTAQAQPTREYFVAHANQNGAPEQLNRRDREYYDALFTAIDRQDWNQVESLFAQRSDGPLHAVARAEYYLAANSPRVELSEIQQWLSEGRNLPQAAQLGRLGVTRGAASLPDLPREQSFSYRSAPPKRVRPKPISDGTMPGSIASQIHDRIVNDDPDGARQLLDGIDSSLSRAARAEWRQRVAWSYYIENMDTEALAMARTVSAGTGPWVAEGDWVAGLASWRLNDCASALPAFERSASGADNQELRSAAYYWAARSALRCRMPDRSVDLLSRAAENDETLYGMLAAEQLGAALPNRVETPEFTRDDWKELRDLGNVHIAIALNEIGRDKLASEVLLHQAKIGDPRQYGALSRLARDLGMPSTQLYMAYNAPAGTSADPAVRYPVPKWKPVTGWQVDPALAYAHALQESNFRTAVVSPAAAKGLMQITPITVREHAPALKMNASHVDLTDPQVNLAFGQQNLEMLRDASATSGQLPKIMAAYNAGLSPVTRWNSEINDQGDPLLYMESIPYWETRGYVAIVMRNYWMYERQADATSSSRHALAQNDWPLFPDADGNGRVYMSAERNSDRRRN
ncbi:lytic transglycosylase domain-containing protein [Altericroceibacterium endophyticum]|uniref:Transglycosylase SLT domain-containing protein n=1 Tax=Altericroceibacterium endophyticum TaxID=1808508 RepID=A0A6I4T5C7_9SPHN|nr:lytic transglycosylase domain-containing protein [Altericroceibacterium endophyticum]MXO66047.1 transglycosylase SLT domain-containing protein [Altericroceibacterium endophyticum]